MHVLVHNLGVIKGCTFFSFFYCISISSLMFRDNIVHLILIHIFIQFYMYILYFLCVNQSVSALVPELDLCIYL